MQPAGQAWTGQQAKGLGLIDGIEDMRSHLCGKFGPKVSTGVIAGILSIATVTLNHSTHK